MTHDTTHLEALGRRRRKLVDQLAEVDAELKPAIFAAAQAGVEQVQIIRWTGMSRETIRVASMTPEQQEAERAKRRAKGGAR